MKYFTNFCHSLQKLEKKMVGFFEKLKTGKISSEIYLSLVRRRPKILTTYIFVTVNKVEDVNVKKTQNLLT